MSALALCMMKGPRIRTLACRPANRCRLGTKIWKAGAMKEKTTKNLGRSHRFHPRNMAVRKLFQVIVSLYHEYVQATYI